MPFVRAKVRQRLILKMPGYKLFTVANLYSSIQLIKPNHLDRNPGRQTEMYILASRHTISDKLTDWLAYRQILRRLLQKPGIYIKYIQKLDFFHTCNINQHKSQFFKSKIKSKSLWYKLHSSSMLFAVMTLSLKNICSKLDFQILFPCCHLSLWTVMRITAAAVSVQDKNSLLLIMQSLFQ